MVVKKCTICGARVVRYGKQVENNKTGNYFCDSKCRAKYLKTSHIASKKHDNKTRKK